MKWIRNFTKDPSDFRKLVHVGAASFADARHSPAVDEGPPLRQKDTARAAG